MGTKIEEAILYMILYKQRLEESVSIGLEKDIEAYDLAITAMHKYQKIQEIYLKWNRNYVISTSDAWTKLIGVIEDGKID